MKYCFLLILCLELAVKSSFSQLNSTTTIYNQALSEIDSMLNEQKPLSFKRVVFITENAYLDGKVDYVEFEEYIQKIARLSRDWMLFNPLRNYRYADSLNVLMNHAIYRVIKDTIQAYTSDSTAIAFLPYTYDFDDFFGQKDWSKMFVVKLMSTHTGNCHSFPYFYKILADEIGAVCWLSFAPNHIYIKNRCDGIGWYNTELTSGQFPLDAWITASGYVSLDAIRSGIFMDTLSNKQAIAQCLLDLAKGYERKTGNSTDSFLIHCCNLVLKYHPVNIAAAIYKADILRKQYQAAKKKLQSEQASKIYREMEQLYARVVDLGYREMPEKMYQDWLQSVNEEKGKYTNEKVRRALQ